MATDASDSGKQAYWKIVIHRGAERELANVTDYADELTHRLKQLRYHEQPTQASYARHLEEEGLFRVRAEQQRALCHIDKPEIQVVAVGHRKTVYQQMSVARGRAGLDD